MSLAMGPLSPSSVQDCISKNSACVCVCVYTIHICISYDACKNVEFDASDLIHSCYPFSIIQSSRLKTYHVGVYPNSLSSRFSTRQVAPRLRNWQNSSAIVLLSWRYPDELRRVFLEHFPGSEKSRVLVNAGWFWRFNMYFLVERDWDDDNNDDHYDDLVCLHTVLSQLLLIHMNLHTVVASLKRSSCPSLLDPLPRASSQVTSFVGKKKSTQTRLISLQGWHKIGEHSDHWPSI